MNFTYHIFVAKPEFFVGGGSHTDSEDIELAGETFSDVEFDNIFDGGDDLGEMPLFMDITTEEQTTIFANSKFEGAGIENTIDEDIFDEAIFGESAQFIDIHDD
jgi:hypothetical protein